MRCQTFLLFACVLALAAGCSCSSDPALDPDAGRGPIPGSDGGRPGDRVIDDECGNGLDDDEDGRVDEGCFCAPGETQGCYPGAVMDRGRGACADGIQECDLGSPTTEFGTWGACDGATLPGEQACDGTDGDCDGAIDEGCPCTDGDERECEGMEGLSAPCTPGVQRCEDGAWSACAGAVSPVSEICDNDVDDDCDGTVDDPSLCACVPEPERCGDGVDNDCDGMIDEPDACRMCTPVAEVCDDMMDNDCDGMVDEGCGACDPAVASPRPVAPMSTSFVTTHRPTLSWDVSGVGATMFRVQVCADRACSTVVDTQDVTGTSARPTSALAPGVYFWDVRSLDGGAVGCPAATWEMVVRTRDTPVDSRFGSMLDLDGDGLTDVAIGAKNAQVVPDRSVGRVFVYHGTGTEAPSTPTYVLESPWTRTSERLQTFGNDLESAGDVNGDGFGDLIVGARYVDDIGTSRPQYRGRAWVFHGGPTGASPTPAVELAIPESDADDGALGRYVAGLGDVDGDGYGDVAVGSLQNVRVYYGSASGVDASTRFELDLPTADYPNAPVVSAGCDTNGDGFADVIVGDASVDDYNGRIYVWEGSASRLSARPDVTLQPDDSDGHGLGFSVTCAGDVDGDGYADIAGGAVGVRAIDLEGRVYTFHGSASGLATRPSTVTADGRRQLGRNLTGMGDVNGDGFDDLMVGWFADPPLTTEAHLVLGSASGLSATPDVQLASGGGFSELGRNPPYMADLDGDGRADVLASGGDQCVFYSSGGFTMSAWGPAATVFAPTGMGATEGFCSRIGALGTAGLP
ncbi:MAG TPA: FG-GAP-like repeat-containing protein [Sandaracinaceae bacterium LLY-WYZ-13_1]|nr:FG-GAP-like repeat-containing protein [Sandaracinaceae bacterium LLY-WYZ-13_1]